MAHTRPASHPSPPRPTHMPEIDVTRTYLELAAPDALRPGRSDEAGLRLERADECPPHFYRYLYGETGRAYHWVDRLGWSDERLRAHLADAGIGVWVLYRRGVPAGWFELARQADGSVEIAYFGLLPGFVGRGLGKHLLTAAAESAWSTGARR
jgi:GNAT superfamily N-acetyltransferase